MYENLSRTLHLCSKIHSLIVYSHMGYGRILQLHARKYMEIKLPQYTFLPQVALCIKYKIAMETNNTFTRTGVGNVAISR